MTHEDERAAEAFAQLYDDTAARVYGVALQVLDEPTQAAQVTEEVYLELWRGGSRTPYASCTTLAALVAHAHRLAVDRARAAARGKEAADPSHPTTAVLSNLPARQAQAIALSYFWGRSCAEVARILDISPRAAQGHIRAGLMLLDGVHRET